MLDSGIAPIGATTPLMLPSEKQARCRKRAGPQGRRGKDPRCRRAAVLVEAVVQGAVDDRVEINRK